MEFRRRNTTKEKIFAQAAPEEEAEFPFPYMPFLKVVTIHPSNATSPNIIEKFITKETMEIFSTSKLLTQSSIKKESTRNVILDTNK